MARGKTRFVCAQCGYMTPKWWGRCPECGEWNTFMEERVEESLPASAGKPKMPSAKAVPLTDIAEEERTRLGTGNAELDRVLGGGLVSGSVVLIGGDPGIGKSTLLLQTAASIAANGGRVLYLSAEESPAQVRLRARRLGAEHRGIMIVVEQDLECLASYIEEIGPDLVIIDSIQTVYSSSLSSSMGSVSQLRESAALITRLARASGVATVIIGHVTKEGSLAGPRLLEHLVDTVIYFEGERNYAYRVLRAVKNRFGSTDEIGLLEMSAQGLQEVKNPSLVLMGDHSHVLPGSALTISMEGTRPLVMEVQSLVATACSHYPRRVASGLDNNRLALILAILEKAGNRQIAALDVYAKVTGGVFVRDPAVDLGLAAAVISSFKDRPLGADIAYIGELGLTGEIRPVSFMQARLREAASLGLAKAAVPLQVARDKRYSGLGIDVEGIASVNDLWDAIV